MTIKDMVAAFHVVDESKEGDGDDKKAIIKCHNSLGTPVNWVGFVDGDDSKKCAHPEYVVNRYVPVTMFISRNSSHHIFSADQDLGI